MRYRGLEHRSRASRTWLNTSGLFSCHRERSPHVSSNLHLPEPARRQTLATTPRAGGVRRQAEEDKEGKSYNSGVLEDASLIAFIPVSEIAVARAFYESTLGLAVLEESSFALVVNANGSKLRLTPVPELRPQPFTVAGWEVADIEATVSELDARGVAFKRFDGMEQRPNGVWQSPSGDLVAWFTDLDDNVLSLTEFTLPPST
jgi:catechol 2,3-dioxygenase-like lactoylglutathione lyase family enzyme